MARLSPREAGDAGEYAAAAELANLGWTVDFPGRGARGVDLYARRAEGDRTCAVQVKSQQTPPNFNVTGVADPVDPKADEWVILVSLADPGKRSRFFVLPRNHVSAVCAAVAEDRARKGQPWNQKYLGGDGLWEPYSEQWGLMDRHASDAAWLMDDWVAWMLAELGRDDIFTLIPTLSRPEQL